MQKQDQDQPLSDKNNSKSASLNRYESVATTSETELSTKKRKKNGNRARNQGHHHGPEDAGGHPPFFASRCPPSDTRETHSQVAPLTTADRQDNKNVDYGHRRGRPKPDKELAYAPLNEFSRPPHHRTVRQSRLVQKDGHSPDVVTLQIDRREDSVAPGAYAILPPPGAASVRSTTTTPPTDERHSTESSVTITGAPIVNDVQVSENEQTQTFDVEANRVENNSVQDNIIILADQDLPWHKRSWNRMLLLAAIITVVLLCIITGMQFRPTSNPAITPTTLPPTTPPPTTPPPTTPPPTTPHTTPPPTTLPPTTLPPTLPPTTMPPTTQNPAIDISTLAPTTSLVAEQVACDFLLFTNLDECRNTTTFSDDVSGSSLPTELGTLTKLRYLALSSNNLVQAIPSEIGALTELTYLDLSSNFLIGAIPSEIGMLIELTDMVLNNNHLSGTIPSEIRSLTQIMSMKLFTNPISGSIPDSLCPHMPLFFIDCGKGIVCNCCVGELGDSC